MAILTRQLSRNTLLAGGQALIGMFSMFWAYRVLMHEVGLELMGLWSILFAGASFARLADVTGAGGLARFVAEAKSRNQDAGIYVHTVTVATIALFAVLSAVAYALWDPLIAAFADRRWHAEAHALAPLVIASSLFCAPLAAMLTSGVDGLHRADLRALLVIASYLVFLAIVLIAVPRFGIWAWGAALIVQQVLTIVGAWLVLRRHLPGLGVLPYRWSTPIFRTTLAFGLKLQINSLANLFSEPLAKLMLGRFGGLEAVALYELAMRLVTSGRGLIVQAAQPLLPEFAAVPPGSPRFGEILQRASRMVMMASFAVLFAVVGAAPLFSIVMMGSFHLDLMVMIVALALGGAINSLAVPYYFAGMGSNVMQWNIGSQFLMAASIITLGGLFGPLYGASGVIGAIVAGLIGGGIMVRLGNSRAFVRMQDREGGD